MAKVNSSPASGNLRGKIGGIVFAQRPDGSTIARGAGEERKPSTVGEKKGQKRMKLAQGYVRSVLADAQLRAPYAGEAERRQMRVCDLVVADYLTDPVIEAVDLDSYDGGPGGPITALMADDFKVVKVSVVIRNAAGQRLEEGPAFPLFKGHVKGWGYKPVKNLLANMPLRVAITATDRCGHSTLAEAFCEGGQ
jgi:hypothetical protein